VEGRLEDPALELFDANGFVAVNNDWREAPNAQEIIDSTIPPTNDREAAILRNVAPGAYTAVVHGIGDTEGTGLFEVYDLGPKQPSQLANISTRGVVRTGNDVMIGGFIVLASDVQGVIVRALGPSLPVAGALADPLLEVYNSNGDLVAANNNWRDGQATELAASGIAPTNDLEAALVAQAPAGAYTAIVRGNDGGSGVGLVEAYAYVLK
jgi:hypothetical protein